MTVKPLSDLILVREIVDRKTENGLLIPETSFYSKDSKVSEVIAIGPGKVGSDGKEREMTIKVGDKIWHKKFAGADITVDEERLIIMNETEVLAVQN